MRLGVPASILLHACALGLAFVSLPDSWRTHVEPEPVVPIALISKAELAEITSVPATRKTPLKPEVEPKPEPPASKEEPPKPQAAEPEPLPVPAPPEEEPKPAEKPPEKPPEKKPPKKPDDLDLERLSQLIDKEREKEPDSGAPAEAVDGERNQERIGPGDRLTASDVAKMQAAVGRCWQTQALIGAPEPEKLVVQVEFELSQDGRVDGQVRVRNALQISLSGNQFWKVAEQVAVRAVISCQPYDFLSAERYHVWREMELTFDPSRMAGF